MNWVRFFSVLGIVAGVVILLKLLFLIIEYWPMFRGVMGAAAFSWMAIGFINLFDADRMPFETWLIGGGIMFIGGGFALFMILIFMGWGVGKVEQAVERHEERKKDVEWLIEQHEKLHIPPPLNVVGQVVYDPPQKQKPAPKPKREKRGRDYNSRTKIFTDDHGHTVMDCGNGIFVKQTTDGVRVERNGVVYHSGHSVDEALEAVRKAYKQ